MLPSIFFVNICITVTLRKRAEEFAIKKVCVGGRDSLTNFEKREKERNGPGFQQTFIEKKEKGPEGKVAKCVLLLVLNVQRLHLSCWFCRPLCGHRVLKVQSCLLKLHLSNFACYSTLYVAGFRSECAACVEGSQPQISGQQPDHDCNKLKPF